jgi:uncharacterized protein (TIGR02271 family)
MMWRNNDVRAGMFVAGTKGERIGKVIRCDKETFIVEKGVFFPKDYELRYDHITDVKDGTVTYSLSDFLARESQLKATSEAPRAAPVASSLGGLAAGATVERERLASTATAERERLASTATVERAKERTAAPGEEVRIPLMKEEVDVEKFSRETGHVRVHKAVRTEEKHFTVPVTREDIVIEHVAVDKDTPLTPLDAAFQEQTVDVALHEEEIRVTKRPVLSEEVVVRTTSRSVEKEGTTTLRHEEAEIEDTRKTPGARIESYSTPGKR